MNGPTEIERRVMAAFRHVWHRLLKEERITSGNIVEVPAMLMTALFEPARLGDTDQANLVKFGVSDNV